MKNISASVFQVTAALVCSFAIHSGRAQTITQTITLQPGWNAVWLEVQPADNSTDSVFANLPIASAWTRAERLSSVEFIQDPSEATFNGAGWLGWFHPSRPEAFLGNLFTLQANRAYLVRCTNTAAVVWNIVGRPSLRAAEWVPDAYTLRGLPVEVLSPPTFQNFFRHSRAHYDPSSGQLEKIYRLNASGQWVQVAGSDVAKSGEAYWIYTREASDYLAPLDAQLNLGDGLDFGAGLTELNVQLNNRGAAPMNALLREFAGPANSILSYYEFNPTLGGQWRAIGNPLVTSMQGQARTQLRLAARRQHLSGNLYESVLEIRDGAGTRLLVPLRAEKDTRAQVATTGLWIGSATLDAVSEPHSANPTNPTPTKSELSLRLIVHVDAGGQARLLKEVIQMWRDGTYTNDASGNRLVDKPGEYVLLTDETLIPLFKGATLRDGESAGRRISTIGYDFPASSSNNFLILSGGFAIGQKLTGTNTLPFDHPTNPFKHKYHPDHDNLDPRFEEPAVESYTTERRIELEPSASPPDGPAVPDYGYNVLGGTYRETITGIHKSAIHVRGTFRLSRVSQIAQLNPSPTP